MPKPESQRKIRTGYVQSKRSVTAGQIAGMVLVLVVLAALFGFILSMG